MTGDLVDFTSRQVRSSDTKEVDDKHFRDLLVEVLGDFRRQVEEGNVTGFLMIPFNRDHQAMDPFNFPPVDATSCEIIGAAELLKIDVLETTIEDVEYFE